MPFASCHVIEAGDVRFVCLLAPVWCLGAANHPLLLHIADTAAAAAAVVVTQATAAAADVTEITSRGHILSHQKYRYFSWLHQ